jgi:hypothetical protein
VAVQGCGAVPTNSVGDKTVSCSATDLAGNTATVNVPYRVIFNFAGFFQPVDNPPFINQMNAGRAVPIKFSLGGNQGLAIFAAGYPQSRQVTCNTFSPIDAVEETLTAGSSTLSYDSTTGRYSYVWKTDKAWGGTCRQFIVKFTDGQTYTVNFSFLR